MSQDKPLSESDIVSTLADQVCRRITRKVIAKLRRMRDTMSGEDSGLRTTWDEICVQVQSEESLYWDAYDGTVRSLLATQVDELSDFEREAIWLQTPEGWEWTDKDECEREFYPVYRGDILDYLAKDYVYREAGSWSNARIESYLDSDAIW